jgi:hypothetical protein
LILAVLLCLIYFWSKHVSSQLQKSVQIFSSFLTKANTESIVINASDIQFTEFQEIALLTNKILEDRRQAESGLLESEKKIQDSF